MKAVRFDDYGGIEVRDVARPELDTRKVFVTDLGQLVDEHIPEIVTLEPYLAGLQGSFSGVHSRDREVRMLWRWAR